jgi:nuclear pore complex protein Nup205
MMVVLLTSDGFTNIDFIGKITIEDTEYQLNDEFINTSVVLADELGIDELVAAELLQNSSNDSTRLDMPPIQGGIALFHVRRQYILDILLFALFHASSTSGVSVQMKKLVNKLSGEQDMLANTLDAMTKIEHSFGELDEKEKRGQFLGQDQNTEFVHTLKLRRDFLSREHDTLGQIMCGLVVNKLLNSSNVSLFVDKLQKNTTYSTLFIHYIPALAMLASTCDPILSPLGQTTTYEDASKLYRALVNRSVEWKLPYWRAAVELIFLTFFAGLAKGDPSAAARVDLQDDVLSPVRRAIDDGALEFLMAVAADTSKESDRLVSFYNYRPDVQIRVPAVKKIGINSNEFLELLLPSLETFVEAFVSNLAEILREMKLSEEDSFLSMANSELNGENQDEAPGMDLERFFIFISYLYLERPNAAASSFWSDTESNLYGFINWAAQSQISFMSVTFCDMLASLSCGKDCANAAFHFLKGSPEANISLKGRRPHKLSWEYIMEALKYYVNQLKPSVQPPSTSVTGARVMVPASDIPELDDDIVLVLQSYFRLMAEVVKYDPEARAELMSNEEAQVISTLFQLLTCQTPLFGAILNVVASFAMTEDSSRKIQIWEALDHWAFNTNIYSPDGTVILPSVSAKERLYSLFRSFDDIVGLITLLEVLLRPPTSTNSFYTLPYPDDLGHKYRVPGIWPYVDFLITEVFYSSTATDFSLGERLTLQLPCLLFMRHALELFDPEVARISAAVGLNPDLVVKSKSFVNYIRVHPCAPTMSHLFNDKIYNIVIGIASTGIDAIAEKKPDDPLVQVLLQSLELINLILNLQETFIDIIIKEIRSTEDGSAPQYGTHGLRSFEDALLFNLPIVTHLALYVGSPNIELAHSSLRLLECLSTAPQFLASSSSTIDSRIKKNRLLSTFETVDESTRIREGFIEQIERAPELYEMANDSLSVVELKMKVLEFIKTNLRVNSKEPTVAHYLLGFRVNGDGTLDMDEERGGILSEVSLFTSIRNLLEYSIASMSESVIEYENSQISSVCSEIFLVLCRCQNTCMFVLNELREHDFLLKSLEIEPNVEARALWNGKEFSEDSDFLTSKSAETIVAFFNHRAALLEYLSMEVHVSAENGALSLVSRYLESLVNINAPYISTFASKAARLLSFLDVLEFQTTDGLQKEYPSVEVFGHQVLEHFYRSEHEMDDSDAINELRYLLRLKGLEFVSTKRISSLEDSDYVTASNDIIETFSRSRVSKEIRNVQLSCLSAWTKLVLVMVNDTELTAGDRSTFILETFQTIIPKLMDYSSSDVSFSELLASLAVSLYKIYQEDMKKIGEKHSKELTVSSGFDRTHSLFRAALSSLQTPLSTGELRADLYIVCYQYLKSCIDLNSRPLLVQNAQVIRASGDKLLEIICSDAISGQGVPRLTSLVLLEVLSLLSISTDSSFVLDSLVRYNLLLLLIQSMKQTDDELMNRQNLTDGELFYEINVFKATLGFLLQVAQTRSGANQLIQCGFFKVLNSCQFLNIDPDVGIGGRRPNETDVHTNFYELLIPVFQVVSAILLSMGPENEPVILRVTKFLDDHQQLTVAILKKDILQQRPESESKLQELVKLLVLLISLTDYVSSK